MGRDAAHPAMLVIARESRAMTQAEVATRMSELANDGPVSQAYVSKAEAGRLTVSGPRLRLYAQALRYPMHVLCADSDLHGVGVGLVHHRKRASLGAPTLRRIHAELALSRMQVRALIRETGRQKRHHFHHVEIDALHDAADAATDVRKEWGMPAGPVDRLVEPIEDAGGLVLVRDLGTRELDAVTQWTVGDAPLFLLNRQAPADRFRFSLAHEIGHVFLHDQPGTTAVQEREADTFASEFLMPAVDVRSELKGGLDLNRLIDLKQRWGVSMAAIARRAVTLGGISEWQYRNVMVEMSALGYRTQEPGDVGREFPCWVSDLVSYLSKDEGYSTARIAELVGLLPDEFEVLYRVEETGVHREVTR